MQKPSKPFQIISVCLLFGILGASALWLAFPPRPSISEEKANGMRYKNAEEYRHVSEWMKTLHGWNLSDSDLAEAKKLLAQGSPAARSMAFIVLSTRVSHKPYDEKITSLLADCARDPDKSMRMGAANWLRRSEAPQAKAALKILLSDPDPQVRAMASGGMESAFKNEK